MREMGFGCMMRALKLLRSRCTEVKHVELDAFLYPHSAVDIQKVQATAPQVRNGTYLASLAVPACCMSSASLSQSSRAG